jgi:putative hydroxymethylpyrimidine transport system substrate-binding protein
MKRKIIGIILTITLVITLTGSSGLAANEKINLMLDWFPNVDHLPVYVAKEKGYFSDHGIDVNIVSPSETSDALKLAASGTMDIAVSYQPQTIIAADRGLALKVVAPLVVHPLTTLLFLEGKGIKSPDDLSSKKIGYTVPGLMDVMLDAFAAINDIKDYTPVNVGFTILPALVSNKVDAVMGPFKTYETVGMARHGYKAQFFELEKWGIPDYEELIFVCSTQTLKAKPDAVKGFVLAMEKAFSYTKAQPEDALATYLSAVPQADKDIETQAFELTRPYFAVKSGHSLAKWQAFADFALKYGLIKNKVNTEKLIHIWK